MSAGGEFSTRFIGAFVGKYAGIDINGNLVDVVGTDGYNIQGVGTNPDLRANVINSYAKGKNSFRASLALHLRHEANGPEPVARVASDESAYTQLDLTYSCDFGTRTNSRLTFAIVNADGRRSSAATERPDHLRLGFV